MFLNFRLNLGFYSHKNIDRGVAIISKVIGTECQV